MKKEPIKINQGWVILSLVKEFLKRLWMENNAETLSNFWQKEEA